MDGIINFVFLRLSLILIFILASVSFYKKVISPAFYWRGRGVFYVNLYHRFFKVFFSGNPFHKVVKDAYDDFPNKRYYGSYQFLRPSLFVRDVELIKKITVKDFEHFHDHVTFTDDRAEPVLNQNLFSLKGHEWRIMRSTLSPAFTSSKMKLMFNLIAKIAEKYTRSYTEALEKSKTVEREMKDFYSRYTLDVIASCAFGIECDCLNDADNEFYKMGSFFSAAFGGLRAFRVLFNFFFPTVARVVDLTVFPKKVIDFFRQLVKGTIEQREKANIIRPDLIHLLMQARKGQLNDDANEVEGNHLNENSPAKLEMTDDVITAQGVVFFIAGFETSSTLLSFTSYALALHPNIQLRLQQEIDETLKQTGGELEYDSIPKMKYLDQVLSEALRFYPPASAISRLCTKDYLIPAKLPDEKDILIEKGCLVAVPLYALHMDPEYFPEPEKFNPERFSEENKAKVAAGSYFPFGLGPRVCIGSRFAMLETKTVLVSLLSKMNIVPTARTEVPLTFARSAILSAKNGIWLGFEKRQK